MLILKRMRKLALLFLGTLVITCPEHGVSREAENDLHNPAPAVSSQELQDTARLNQFLFNGKIWLGMYFNVYGTEFLIEDKWYKADIKVNDIHFKDVDVKYDIYNDNLLANYYNKRIIILNKENIEAFTLYTGDRNLFFINEKGRNGLDGYYQVIYEGDTRLLKKWRKKRAQFVIEARYDEFQPDNVLIFVKDQEIYQVKNRRKLLRIFGDNKREIRSFIRQENIHLDPEKPESIVPVLEFFDSLQEAR